MIPGIIEAGLKILDKVLPDPAAKAEAQLRLMELHQNGDLKELESRYAAITTEAQSVDPWTSRARPSFMYVFYLVIVVLVLLAPVIGVFWPERMAVFFVNVGVGFEAIPEPMWWTFTAGYLGYTGARTYEKQSRVA